MDGFEDLRRTYRDAAIVCGALVASVLIYTVVVEVLRTQLPPGGVGSGISTDLLRYAFYLLAGVEGLAIPSCGARSRRGPGSERACCPGCGRAPW